MFRTHWGLRESPFRGSLDWRLFHPSPTHDEALARMQFLVEERRRMGLLLGPTGSGKSMVLEVFARRLRRKGAQVANLNMLGIDLHEFLWLTAAELGANPDRRHDVFHLWRMVVDRIAENRYQQIETVLLLDDADEAPPNALEQVVRIAQQDCSQQARLSIVLAASSDAAGRLLPRLLELAELRIDIEPWEPADTVEYINVAIKHAGRASPAFTEEAIHRLHDLCDGLPRRINQLANLTLLAGAGRNLSQIDTDTVESAYHELSTVQAVA
ncbi:MAG: AAA family ATPase [Pirellulales bacterium]|nr:AAA family ATPase [Pirellulales bacterium]